MKLVYYWSPFLTHVATISAVIESAISLKKYSDLYDPVVIDVCGEFQNYTQVLSENNIKILRLSKFRYFKFLPKNGYLKSRFSYLVIFFYSIFPLYKVIKKNKPNFFICHLITSLPILLANLFNFDTKFVLRISGLPKLNIIRKNYWKIFGKALFKITSPTEATIRYLKNINLFEEKKIFLLRDPVVDIRKIYRLKKEKIEPFLKNEEFILGVGRLTRQKNFSFLINCFFILCEENKNLKLVILGDGEEKKKLTKIIIKNKLEEKVLLLGHSNNIFKYLSKAKFFILSSLWEDPGWVLIEAAASNTLILSSDCKNGPLEIIEENKGGQLYEVSNENDFLKNFNIINSLNKLDARRKKIFAKKKIYHFTKFQHCINLQKIIDN